MSSLEHQRCTFPKKPEWREQAGFGAVENSYATDLR